MNNISRVVIGMDPHKRSATIEAMGAPWRGAQPSVRACAAEAGMVKSLRRLSASARGRMMPAPNEEPPIPDPPDWARDEAADELYEEKDRLAITKRAWELVMEREDERHDAYDDPDQGGEA
jgi:hypothetical protein